MRCALCGIVVNATDELHNINKKTPYSKKAIYGIFAYLAKTARPPIDILWPGKLHELKICKACVGDILIYDEFMVKLLEVQKRIVSLLRNLQYVELQIPDERALSADKELDVKLQQIERINDVDIHNNVSKHEIAFTSETNENEEISKEVFAKVAEGRLSDSDDRCVETTKAVRKYNIPSKCNLCCKIFKNKTLLNRHVNIAHKTSKKSCTCDICGVVTKDEEYMELHMNIHDGKSDLECRYCCKRYTRKINVIRHMHKHWDKKKFQCERCGLRFSERHMYYNHRLQHEAEEEPLICGVCNQSFKTRRTYTNHLWVHREDRPRYSCEICEKTFVEKYTLKVHLRCHSNAAPSGGRRKSSDVRQNEEKPFTCIICGDQFLTNGSCDYHMKNQHDVILEAEEISV